MTARANNRPTPEAPPWLARELYGGEGGEGDILWLWLWWCQRFARLGLEFVPLF
jgi:hypothetical protein